MKLTGLKHRILAASVRARAQVANPANVMLHNMQIEVGADGAAALQHPGDAVRWRDGRRAVPFSIFLKLC